MGKIRTLSFHQQHIFIWYSAQGAFKLHEWWETISTPLQERKALPGFEIRMHATNPATLILPESCYSMKHWFLCLRIRCKTTKAENFRIRSACNLALLTVNANSISNYSSMFTCLCKFFFFTGILTIIYEPHQIDCAKRTEVNRAE